MKRGKGRGVERKGREEQREGSEKQIFANLHDGVQKPVTGVSSFVSEKHIHSEL